MSYYQLDSSPGIFKTLIPIELCEHCKVPPKGQALFYAQREKETNTLLNYAKT